MAALFEAPKRQVQPLRRSASNVAYFPRRSTDAALSRPERQLPTIKNCTTSRSQVPVELGVSWMSAETARSENLIGARRGAVIRKSE